MGTPVEYKIGVATVCLIMACYKILGMVWAQCWPVKPDEVSHMQAALIATGVPDATVGEAKCALRRYRQWKINGSKAKPARCYANQRDDDWYRRMGIDKSQCGDRQFNEKGYNSDPYNPKDSRYKFPSPGSQSLPMQQYTPPVLASIDTPPQAVSQVAAAPAHQSAFKGAAPQTLDVFLTVASLSHVCDAIVDLGVVDPSDFVDVTDQDLQECGLKSVEIRRLRRQLASTAEDVL
eukprot:COSAG01_NODE_9591_length_2399_cov_3.761739_2_plen_235_part_00